MHLYIFDISYVFYSFIFINISLTTAVFTAGVGFSNIPEKKKIPSSLSKILETGINVFKSNSRIIKKLKIFWNINFIRMHSTIVWMISFKFNWIIYDGMSWENATSWICMVLNVFKHFLIVHALDRSKIGNDQYRIKVNISLNPLSFFANTPFKNFNIRRDQGI